MNSTTNVSQHVINQTIIREATNTVSANATPILVSSQPSTSVPQTKMKRSQRVLKPKPSGTDAVALPSGEGSSQESSVVDRLEKPEGNDILAKAAESIFDNDDMDFADSSAANYQKNEESSKPSLDNTNKNVKSNESNVGKVAKCSSEKRKASSDVNVSPQKRLKPSSTEHAPKVGPIEGSDNGLKIPSSHGAKSGTRETSVAVTNVSSVRREIPVSRVAASSLNLNSGLSVSVPIAVSNAMRSASSGSKAVSSPAGTSVSSAAKVVDKSIGKESRACETAQNASVGKLVAGRNGCSTKATDHVKQTEANLSSAASDKDSTGKSNAVPSGAKSTPKPISSASKGTVPKATKSKEVNVENQKSIDPCSASQTKSSNTSVGKKQSIPAYSLANVVPSGDKQRKDPKSTTDQTRNSPFSKTNNNTDVYEFVDTPSLQPNGHKISYAAPEASSIPKARNPSLGSVTSDKESAKGLDNRSSTSSVGHSVAFPEKTPSSPVSSASSHKTPYSSVSSIGAQSKVQSKTASIATPTGQTNKPVFQNNSCHVSNKPEPSSSKQSDALDSRSSAAEVPSSALPVEERSDPVTGCGVAEKKSEMQDGRLPNKVADKASPAGNTTSTNYPPNHLPGNTTSRSWSSPSSNSTFIISKPPPITSQVSNYANMSTDVAPFQSHFLPGDSTDKATANPSTKLVVTSYVPTNSGYHNITPPKSTSLQPRLAKTIVGESSPLNPSLDPTSPSSSLINVATPSDLQSNGSCSVTKQHSVSPAIPKYTHISSSKPSGPIEAPCKANTSFSGMAPVMGSFSSSPCSFPGTSITGSTVTAPSLANSASVSSSQTVCSTQSISDSSPVPPSSSGFLSITQLTNPPCNMSLNELLTSSTMPDIPAVVGNVSSDSNSANSPFSVIPNLFGSSSPDVHVHVPMQPSRGYCESTRNSSSFSASDLVSNSSNNLGKDSSAICSFNAAEFSNPLASHNAVNDMMHVPFDKQGMFPSYQQDRNSQNLNRQVFNSAKNNQAVHISAPIQSSVVHDPSNHGTPSSAMTPLTHSISPVQNTTRKDADQMLTLGNMCSLDVRNNAMPTEMSHFNHDISRAATTMNQVMSAGKPLRNEHETVGGQSHVDKVHNNTNAQGKGQSVMTNIAHKNSQMIDNSNTCGTVNFADLWQPNNAQNSVSQSYAVGHSPRHVSGMVKETKSGHQGDQAFLYQGWHHEQNIYPTVNNCNSGGTYPTNQSRSPSVSSFRQSPAAHTSPGANHPPTTMPSSLARSSSVHQSHVPDINKANSTQKSNQTYGCTAPASIQDARNFTAANLQQKTAAPCFNSSISAYHRASNSYSAEALIGDSINSCSKNQNPATQTYHSSKSILHSAESLLPALIPNHVGPSVQHSTLNFQPLNPVVSSSGTNPSSHFNPGLNLIPRPRFPGFPVPGSNNNSLSHVGQQPCSAPVDENLTFGWPLPPRLPTAVSIAGAYPNTSYRNTTKSSQAKNRSQKSAQSANSSNSPHGPVNPFHSSAYDRSQTHHNVINQSSAISSAPSTTPKPKTANSRNSSSKSKSKSSNAKKNHRSSTSLPSSSLEEVNLSGSIFETNRSITPYFGVPNFSPPRTDTPTYLPNINTPSRSQSHDPSVSTSICNTFGTPLFPPRCQSNLNLNFPQTSSNFGVNAIHHHTAVPSQMTLASSTNVTAVSTTPHFHLSNIFPDISNSSTPVPSSALAPIKFHHGNHFAPPSAGAQVAFEPHLQQKATTGAPSMYNGRPPPPPVLHSGMSINSILGNTSNNSSTIHHNHGSSYDSRQSHPQVGAMAPPHPSLVHPQGPNPFSNVLHSLNFSVQDH